MGDFLTHMLQTEVLYVYNDIFTTGYRDCKALAQIKSDFKSQIRNYACRRWPFNIKIQKGEMALSWWKRSLATGEAKVLAVSDAVDYF